MPERDGGIRPKLFNFKIGKIEIHDNFAYVAVASEVSAKALKSLGQGRIKGKRFVVTRVCDACAAHCAELVADGKKEHFETLRTCQDCAAVCRAAGSVTARTGPMSDAICPACAEVCKRCGDACERHAADPVMKKCADECRACEKACREMLKHTGAR